MTSEPLHLLAVVEAATITGPAKNLLDFRHSTDTATLALSFATYHRSREALAPDAAPTEFIVRSRAAGVPVDVIAERFPFDRRAVSGLRRVAAQRQPHIVETHHVKSHFLFRLSGAWRTRRWVAFHHGYTTTDAKVRLYNHLDRWSLRAAHCVITVNKPFAAQLAAIGVPKERIHVLHNAVIANWLTPERAGDTFALRAKLGIAPHERIILAVGRFSHEKALDDLVAAFALLPLPEAHLVLVGDGPQRPVVQAQAASLGVEKRTHFIGQVSDPAPYYALADALALPSLSEGSPLALLEAMGAGLPIAATKVGGIPEMVDDGKSALLVERRQPDQLAKALKTLLTDENFARRLGRAAQQRAATHFTPQAHRDARLKIYRELLGKE
jgi:glycosyltransferase involved in cell wall biosynthesis